LPVDRKSCTGLLLLLLLLLPLLLLPLLLLLLLLPLLLLLLPLSTIVACLSRKEKKGIEGGNSRKSAQGRCNIER
jgi:hypothetical protein